VASELIASAIADDFLKVSNAMEGLE
jgi:hypothetical protein